MHAPSLTRMLNLSPTMTLALSLWVLVPVDLQGQRDWPMYGLDEKSTRYSTLKEINTQNVGTLSRAWTYHMGRPGAVTAGSPNRGGRRRASEATPIVVKGVLYMPTPYNTIIALEPESGKELWSYTVRHGVPGPRSVAYYKGDKESAPALFFGTNQGYLIALNPETGKEIPGFGDNGAVNMKPGVDNGFPNAQFGLSSPPIIYKNLVITGSRVQEAPSMGVAGDTRAWDARTGKLVWQFHSVPRPGETGHETWDGNSADRRSGTNVWGLTSIDVERGLVFLPHGTATPDFYGGDRKGANLFGNSLVALDARTGKLKWHFQTVHHDIWDYDLASAPVLIDVVQKGKKIPAVAIISKAGMLFILDRRNGKPVYEVEERPVPASAIPGEHSWPTQPFPVKPHPLGRTSFKPDEVATVTPEHKKFCEDLLASDGGMLTGGPYTPWGSKMTVVFPGTLGVTNWPGISYDPKLSYLFFNTTDLADVGKLVKAPEGSPVPYEWTGPQGPYSRFWNPENFWPCQQPPWGQLWAINVNTGEVAWKIPFGIIEELEAKGVHGTGSMNFGGSIATAGGLLFIAATNDQRFRAFDSKTGKELWVTKLETGAYTTPITYQGKNGKQYVLIVATGGSFYDKTSGDSVIAFALP